MLNADEYDYLNQYHNTLHMAVTILFCSNACRVGNCAYNGIVIIKLFILQHELKDYLLIEP